MLRTRREILRHLAGAGGLSLFASRFLAGCDDGSATPTRDAAVEGALDGSLPLDAAGSADSALVDPEGRWWLSGNYAPVADEVEILDLTIDGALPPELVGTYVRNGSNPQAGSSGHWFLGDGMLHGLRLEGGRARWYRNRFIQTAQLAQPGGGGPVPTLERNGSNVSLVHHARKILTLGEVGYPYEVRADLSTVGLHTFGGQLTTAMTAHPKVDPVTGELLFFGYWFLPPYLTYHRADASGALVYSQEVALPASVMMHDFAITETRVVFMDLPILFDLAVAAAGGSFPFKWTPSNGARLGLMDRAGGAVRWFAIEACFSFHVLNAFDMGNKVVVDVVRHPSLWANGVDDFTSEPRLWRFIIDPDADEVAEAQLSEHPLEFPMGDRRFTGRPHRHAWAVGSEGIDFLGPDARHLILHHDLQTGAVRQHALGATHQTSEALFVPGGAGEGEGWLLAWQYDRTRNASDLAVYNATDVEPGPIARVRLPRRVPFGFHGAFIPDET